MNNKIRACSFFSGCGGLDLGFSNAGFDVVFANDNDKHVWETYQKNNNPDVLNKKSILDLSLNEIPDSDIFIGGPPCQPFSESGAKRGLNDQRGRLFLDYVNIIREKKPKVVLAENVRGLLAPRNKGALEKICSGFEDAGYRVYFKLLNACDFGVAQDRLRLIIVGVRSDFVERYSFPEVRKKRKNLSDVISDLEFNVVKYPSESVVIPNHHYPSDLSYSSMYMSRNRVRLWNEPSFTIQASARQAPQHPSVGRMLRVGKELFVFPGGSQRRLSVRECARIQGFPDSFEFIYKDINRGYRMVGNAVPVRFAEELAISIKEQLFK